MLSNREQIEMNPSRCCKVHASYKFSQYKKPHISREQTRKSVWVWRIALEKYCAFSVNNVFAVAFFFSSRSPTICRICALSELNILDSFLCAKKKHVFVIGCAQHMYFDFDFDTQPKMSVRWWIGRTQSFGKSMRRTLNSAEEKRINFRSFCLSRAKASIVRFSPFYSNWI